MAASTHTPRSLLADAGLPAGESRILLAHVLGVSRTWLIAHDTDAISADDARRFGDLTRRRLAGEPIAYLVGEREFMGRRFKVSPEVLIPRPETELLVEVGLAHLASVEKPLVLDLGTGSGAIAIALALERPDARVIATDTSKAALALAHENAMALHTNVRFLRGDWWQALAGLAETRFDLIVSNPPYIEPDDIHLEQGDLRFEPAAALTEGVDGLSAMRIIVAGAPSWLAQGGAVWLEHGYNQAEAVRGYLRQAKLQQVASRPDLAGIDRISGGVLLL